MGTRIRESLTARLRHVNKSVCPRSTRRENRGRNSFFFSLSPLQRVAVCGDIGRRGEKGGTQRALISAVASRHVIFGANHGDKDIFVEILAFCSAESQKFLIAVVNAALF